MGIPRALARLGPQGLRAVRGYASAAGGATEQNLEEWKQRAGKEAKGRDPWQAFSSTNQDVRRAAACVLCWLGRGVETGQPCPVRAAATSLFTSAVTRASPLPVPLVRRST